MQDCALHTVLRLPRGTFTPYSQGVKANVIFFQKGRPTEHVRIFDARSNVPGITKKDRPLTPQHFTEFEDAYGKDPNGLSKRKDTGNAGRFRKFHVSEIKERGYKLDVTWLKDDSLEDADELPEPQTSPPKPSPNSKPWWTTSGKSSRSWKRKRACRNEPRRIQPRIAQITWMAG
jgi:type I restriction enzyme M protein